MSKYVIYHHNDTDGRMSAAIMVELLKKQGIADQIVLHEIDYTVELSDVDDTNYFDQPAYPIFVDYSFSKESNILFLEELIKYGVDVIWIDHHKTSVDVLERIKDDLDDVSTLDSFINTDNCAAYLCYEYAMDVLNNNEAPEYIMPNIIKYTSSYDCWSMSMDNTLAWHYGILEYGIRPATFFKSIIRKNDYNIFNPDAYTIKKLDGFNNRCIRNGSTIMKYVDLQNAELDDLIGFDFLIIDDAYSDNQQISVRAINQRGNSRMFGDDMATYDIVMPFYYKDGKWVFSLFTAKPELDVSKYATLFGNDKRYGAGSGGGHRAASGGVLREMPFSPNCNIVLTKKLISKRIRMTVIAYNEDIYD